MKKEEIRNNFAKMIIGSLFCIDQETKLRGYKFYTGKTKEWGGTYVDKLKTLESDTYFKLSSNNEPKEEEDEFFNQLIGSVDNMNSIMDCLMRLKNESQRQYFNDELDKLVAKFNLIDNENNNV